jgi:hypothetical protein
MQPSLIWIKTAGSSTPHPCLSDLPAEPKAGTPTSPSCRRLPGERRCFLSFSCWPRAHCLWIISASHPTRSDVFSLTITQKFFHLQQGIEPFQSGTDFEIGSFFILNQRRRTIPFLRYSHPTIVTQPFRRGKADRGFFFIHPVIFSALFRSAPFSSIAYHLIYNTTKKAKQRKSDHYPQKV